MAYQLSGPGGRLPTVRQVRQELENVFRTPLRLYYVRILSSDCRAIWGYLAISYYLILSVTIQAYLPYLDHPQAVS